MNLQLPGGGTTANPLSLAIANAEGYAHGSAGTGKNNPGDIFVDGELATFPDPQTGWDKLDAQIHLYVTGQSSHAGPSTTLAQLAPIYTGNDDALDWARNVAAGLTGIVPGSTILEAITANPTPQLLLKMGRFWSGIMVG